MQPMNDILKADSGLSKEQRHEKGKALRDKCPRESHSHFKPAAKRDPIGILTEISKGRIEDLIPIKYGRMMESPFAFYRGGAAIMAADLAATPSTGINIQICGDCHLMNFGGFATPERKMVFDINDFDETTVAPWEWDVKRLATSFAIAAQWRGFKDKEAQEAAWHAANSYRRHMGEYAEMSVLDVWYSLLDLEDIVKMGNDKDIRKFYMKRIDKALGNSAHEKEFAKLTYHEGKKARIKDEPPLIYHADEPKQAEFMVLFKSAFSRYLETLSHDKKILLSRYTVQDIAMKVVGVGSVGTMCGIALLMSESEEPLFLQLKEAFDSALEPYTGKSTFESNGQRVVAGQKLMQSATDIFLGWTISDRGRNFYIRQLRDAKVKPVIEIMGIEDLTAYAKACGWALARAHAKAGDPVVLRGYLGSSQEFEDAIATFAVAYSQQNEKDYELLLKAIKSGDLPVQQIPQ